MGFARLVNVVYTSLDQTISGIKTFVNNTIFNSNVGIGTSSPSYPLVVAKSDTSSTLGSSNASLHIVNTDSAAYGRLAELVFNVLNQNVNSELACISAQYTNYGGSYGADLIFSTNQGTGGTVTERFRISRTGKVTVNGVGLLAIGQTWQDMTSSRASGTTYTNSSGSPIVVSITANNGTTLYVDGVAVQGFNLGSGSAVASFTAIVPSGSTYSFTAYSTIVKWFELR